MSLHLTTDDWVAIAGGSTIINMVALRWCMPTPKAKRQISFLPLGGSVLLVSSAVAEGYSASFTPHLYSCILLTFVVILAPVNTFSLYWIEFSSTGCIVPMLYIWAAID